VTRARELLTEAPAIRNHRLGASQNALT
jgi:hypothetical protein